MPNQRSPDIVQIGQRVTKALRLRLMTAAKASGRSLNAEINARIEQTFRREEADKILDKAQIDLAEAKRIHNLTVSNLAELQEAIQAHRPG